MKIELKSSKYWADEILNAYGKNLEVLGFTPELLKDESDRDYLVMEIEGMDDVFDLWRTFNRIIMLQPRHSDCVFTLEIYDDWRE